MANMALYAHRIEEYLCGLVAGAKIVSNIEGGGTAFGAVGGVAGDAEGVVIRTIDADVGGVRVHALDALKTVGGQDDGLADSTVDIYISTKIAEEKLRVVVHPISLVAHTEPVDCYIGALALIAHGKVGAVDAVYCTWLATSR